MNEQLFDPQNTEDALYFKDTNCPAEFTCKIFEVSLKKLKRSYQLTVLILVLNGSVCPDSHAKSNLILIQMGGSEPVQWFSNDTAFSLELSLTEMCSCK